jgi:hypothetical protein
MRLYYITKVLLQEINSGFIIHYIIYFRDALCVPIWQMMCALKPGKLSNLKTILSQSAGGSTDGSNSSHLWLQNTSTGT